MDEVAQQPQIGARDSTHSDPLLNKKRPTSHSAASPSLRVPNGANRKGRFSAIVSTMNPLPVLGKGFRRRKDSQEDSPSLKVSSPKSTTGSSKSTTGFTAVASKIEDFESKDVYPSERRSRSDTLILLDPDAIAESTQSFLRKSSTSRVSNSASIDSPKPTVRSLPTGTPNSERYLSALSKNEEDGARDSRENTPKTRGDHSVRPFHITPEPKPGRTKSRGGQGNRGHYKRRDKERRRPTQIDILLSLKELNLVVAVFMVAMSLAEITGKVLSSIGTTIFLAIGLNQWSRVHKLRRRRKEKLRLRQLKKQSSRIRRRNDAMRRKDAAVLDIS